MTTDQLQAAAERAAKEIMCYQSKSISEGDVVDIIMSELEPTKPAEPEANDYVSVPPKIIGKIVGKFVPAKPARQPRCLDIDGNVLSVGDEVVRADGSVVLSNSGRLTVSRVFNKTDIILASVGGRWHARNFRKVAAPVPHWTEPLAEEDEPVKTECVMVKTIYMDMNAEIHEHDEPGKDEAERRAYETFDELETAKQPASFASDCSPAFFDRDGVTIYNGDCRTVLASLPSESVHCCVTSPPYWGLRDYGTATWDGGDAACDHRKADIRMRNNLAAAANACDGGKRTQAARQDNDLGIPYSDTCGKCGARRIDSQLGLELTPAEYVEKMVAVFREVRRVLRDDGTLWLNLGDSYATRLGGDGWGDYEWKTGGKVAPAAGTVSSIKRTRADMGGLKPKDLCGIPWRVAFALQADGWYLRQDIIWHKPNPMPESVTDRCTKAHEYLFLLSKSERYHCDMQAISEHSTQQNGAAASFKRVTKDHLIPNQSAVQHRLDREDRVDDGKRNKRSVWTVPTHPFAGAHFATFPPALIEPCIKAGCPEGGTVLDPFLGSGTTAEVAQRQGCRCVGIELNAEYAALAAKRFRQRSLLSVS